MTIIPKLVSNPLPKSVLYIVELKGNFLFVNKKFYLKILKAFEFLIISQEFSWIFFSLPLCKVSGSVNKLLLHNK
jgi:hypothetical protein